jgi:hypothetical protein
MIKAVMTMQQPRPPQKARHKIYGGDPTRGLSVSLPASLVKRLRLTGNASRAVAEQFGYQVHPPPDLEEAD